MKSKLTFTRQPSANGLLDPTLFSRAVELFDRHGTLWIENVLSRAFVAELHEAYTDTYASLDQQKLRRKYAAVGDKRFMVTVDIKPPFDSVALFANPRLMPIIRRFVSDDCLISSFGSVIAFPGSDPQAVHFDHPPLFESESLCCQLPPHAITLVVPLIDLDERTGTTAIWEGSHRQLGSRERLRRLSAQSSLDGGVLPLARMGDVYLMDYRIIHAGTANRSEIPRPILYIVYSRPWFSEDDNFAEQPPIKITRKRFKKLPKAHRGLLARASFK